MEKIHDHSPATRPPESPRTFGRAGRGPEIGISSASPGACHINQRQFQQTAIELALPMLDHPGSRDLLLGYAAMLGVWAIENELLHPDENSPRYLAPILARLHTLSG